jgi:predicted O-methyltransferase YrrM
MLWRVNGRPVPPPNQVKHQNLRRLARKHGLRVLVETGTYKGSTALALHGSFDQIHTIELSPEIYEANRETLGRLPNVRTLLGNSADRLPEIVAALDSAALFWLDAHFSGGDTARGPEVCPVMAELDIILRDDRYRHVIVVDDARDFRGASGYPSVSQITDVAARLRGYRGTVSDDAIRLEPTS